MKSLRKPALLTVLVGLLTSISAAQPRSYITVAADIPFKFQIGERTFKPGHYELVIVGSGIVALRDSRRHVVSSFLTRELETPAANQNKLVFGRTGGRLVLKQIRTENPAQVLEVLRENAALPQSSVAPQRPPLIDSFFWASPVPRLR